MYIESITEKLNNPNLQNENNEGRIVLDGTIGEYLENYDNHLYDLFLVRAKGGYLDLHSNLHHIYRHDNETDEELRKRVLTDIHILQNTNDFLDLDISLWVYQDDVIEDKNILTSRNTYLRDLHDTDYIFIATGEDSDYLKNKFVLEDILWV